MKTLDEGLAEAISSIIWVTPRLQADVQELKIVSEQLAAKVKANPSVLFPENSAKNVICKGKGVYNEAVHLHHFFIEQSFPIHWAFLRQSTWVSSILTYICHYILSSFFNELVKKELRQNGNQFFSFCLVRQALRDGMRCQRRGHRLREADAQDERSSAAKDHNRKVYDRNRQVLQRWVRTRPTGNESSCVIDRILLIATQQNQYHEFRVEVHFKIFSKTILTSTIRFYANWNQNRKLKVAYEKSASSWLVFKMATIMPLSLHVKKLDTTVLNDCFWFRFCAKTKPTQLMLLSTLHPLLLFRTKTI